MTLDLLKRSESGVPLTLAQHDANFTAIETAVNASGEVINVKTDHGAVGNGTTNDLPALNAATTAALLTGRTIYFPPGVYRITGQWLIGNTVMGTDFTNVISENYTLGVTDDTTQIIASKAHVAPSIIGASGAVIWGDFVPSVTTPIVYYGVELTQGNANVYNTPVTIEGISIVGKPGYSSGVATDPGGDASITGTKQIGLACARGARLVRNLSIRACQVGLASQAAYWARYDTIYTWRCETGIRFKNGNAITATNLAIWYGDKGVIFDGDAATIGNINTQQVAEDLIVQYAYATTFGPGYLEDVTSIDGTGKFAVKLGAASGGNTVNYCTFQGLKIGSTRPNKGGFRYWAALKNTFIGMQQAGRTLTYDSISGGAQIASDYAFPIGQMPILANRFFGAINGGDSGNHFLNLRSGWLDNLTIASLASHATAGKTVSVPGVVAGDIVVVCERYEPASPGISWKARAIADAIVIYYTNNTTATLTSVTASLLFQSWTPPVNVFNSWT